MDVFNKTIITTKKVDGKDYEKCVREITLGGIT